MSETRKALHVVGAILLDKDRILVARRAPHKSAAGLWEFPGGKVDAGEEPFDALVREIHEELSLTIEPIRTFDVSDTLIGETVIRLEVIVCRVLSHFAGLSSDHDDFIWVGPGELSTLAWAAPDLPAVQELQKYSDFGAFAE